MLRPEASKESLVETPFPELQNQGKQKASRRSAFLGMTANGKPETKHFYDHTTTTPDIGQGLRGVVSQMKNPATEMSARTKCVLRSISATVENCIKPTGTPQRRAEPSMLVEDTALIVPY